MQKFTKHQLFSISFTKNKQIKFYCLLPIQTEYIYVMRITIFFYSNFFFFVWMKNPKKHPSMSSVSNTFMHQEKNIEPVTHVYSRNDRIRKRNPMTKTDNSKKNWKIILYFNTLKESKTKNSNNNHHPFICCTKLNERPAATSNFKMKHKYQHNTAV